MALDGEIDKFARIDKMLRTKVAGRPLASLIELYAQKVSAVSENAIPDVADKLSVAIVHSDIGPRCDRVLQLETDAGKRDIFQIRDPAALLAGTIAPDHFDEVGAQQPRSRSPFLGIVHTF